MIATIKTVETFIKLKTKRNYFLFFHFCFSLFLSSFIMRALAWAQMQHSWHNRSVTHSRNWPAAGSWLNSPERERERVKKNHFVANTNAKRPHLDTYWIHCKHELLLFMRAFNIILCKSLLLRWSCCWWRCWSLQLHSHAQYIYRLRLCPVSSVHAWIEIVVLQKHYIANVNAHMPILQLNTYGFRWQTAYWWFLLIKYLLFYADFQ